MTKRRYNGWHAINDAIMLRFMNGHPVQLSIVSGYDLTATDSLDEWALHRYGFKLKSGAWEMKNGTWTATVTGVTHPNGQLPKKRL